MYNISIKVILVTFDWWL